MDNLNIERYFGFSEEKKNGIAETEAEMHLDPKSLSPGIPSDTEITYTGSIGRGKNIHRPGPYLNSPRSRSRYRPQNTNKTTLLHTGKSNKRTTHTC
jgi:hypothetical protein